MRLSSGRPGAAEEFLDSILPAKVLLVSARVQVYSEDIQEAVRHAQTSPMDAEFSTQSLETNTPRPICRFRPYSRQTPMQQNQRDLSSWSSARPASMFRFGNLKWSPPSPQLVNGTQRFGSIPRQSTAPFKDEQLNSKPITVSSMQLSPVLTTSTMVVSSKYDRALRVYIGQTRRLLLDDAGTLHEIRHAHLAETGLHVTQTIERHQLSTRDRSSNTSHTVATATPASSVTGIIQRKSARTGLTGALESNRDALLHRLALEQSESDNDGVACYLPQFMRGMGWKEFEQVSYSRTARYTEFDEPLPRPSPSEFSNELAMRTILENPDLFQVPQVIRVDRLEAMLDHHPNQPFIHSVLTGLREGFWPWVNTHHDAGYPSTWDNSWAPPPSERERDFITNQRAGGPRAMITAIIPSRQPVREAWSHERFERELAIALNASVDISTTQTYGSALNSWIEFCRINHFSIRKFARP
ncbi:RNase H domain-containing protein [Mycena indigotica]|uniref:RNase H domain-containing protein n=1 Tax=Mycena indigotica TaxID=2126181 RepID=A0A8H6TFP9_9AGAR|nr:RNase H domain-containing protein [Mycena indigotica]KAF7315836.1 RNase H domain-containing protein [Mycena indigotica]